MDANQLLANGFDQQGGNHGGIYAAAQGQQNLLITYLLADFGYLLGDECIGKGLGSDALHGFGTNIITHIGFLHI